MTPSFPLAAGAWGGENAPLVAMLIRIRQR